MVEETIMERGVALQAVISIRDWAAMIVLVPGEMICVEAVTAWTKVAVGDPIGVALRVVVSVFRPVAAVVEPGNMLEAMSTFKSMLMLK